MRVTRRDVTAVCCALVCALQPSDRVPRTAERDVEQMPKVVRIPWVLRGGRERVVVRAHCKLVVTKEGLAKREHRPTPVVARAVGYDAARAERGAPGVPLDQQL